MSIALVVTEGYGPVGSIAAIVTGGYAATETAGTAPVVPTSARTVADQYREQLKALLPPGNAFPRDPGNNIEKLLDGMAQELARLDGRAQKLVREANPMTTSELLLDWERVAGLPDNCSGTLANTLQGRINALVSKVASVGGQTKQYFIDVAAALGYTVTITEYFAFVAGSHAGDAVSNDDWAFTWRMNAPETTVISFRAGRSASGEPLRTWGNDELECKINQLKPAHTHVIYSYGGEP